MKIYQKILLGTLSVLSAGAAYGAFKLGQKIGFDDGAKHVGDQLFNGNLTVIETDPETGLEKLKVVDPVLKNPGEVSTDFEPGVSVVHF